MAILENAGPPPPDATSFFIADLIGGSGWEIELPDGLTEKYYVVVPPDPRYTLDVAVHWSGLPENVPDYPVELCAAKYFNYLNDLVAEAEKKFGEPG